MNTTSNRSQLWLLILLFAIVIDLIVPLILGNFYPNYNHLTDTVSILGSDISPVKQWESMTLICVGILFCLFGYGQLGKFHNKGKYEKLYVTGIFLFGIGSILAGIFPEDFKGMEKETVSGKIHGIASFIGFIFLILCPFWATRIKQIKTSNRLNYLLFILALVSFFLFLYSENIEFGFFKYTGLLQRTNLLILYFSMVINYQKLKYGTQ